MSTFDGKSYNYVPGKQPKNKEPLYNAVGKKLLEKLYETHRKRVMNVDKTVDDQLEVFDFLTDQSWKQVVKRHHELELMKHNEVFYARLSKLENTETKYSKEMKFHIKHIKNQSEYSKKLKEHSRFLFNQKINRDNEHLHQRLTNAQPFYSRQRFKQEYDRALFAKSGRRGDHTAGHLLRISKELKPKFLPKILPSALTPTERALVELRSKQKAGGFIDGLISPEYSAMPSPSSRSFTSFGSPMSLSSMESSFDFGHKMHLSSSIPNQNRTNTGKTFKKDEDYYEDGINSP